MTVDQYFGCLVFISDKIPSEYPVNNQDINLTSMSHHLIFHHHINQCFSWGCIHFLSE